MMKFRIFSLLILSCFLLSGCNLISRIQSAGREPPFTKIENPVARKGYRPISMPMPDPEPTGHYPNSLWRTGAKSFFKDQRAKQIGDILTIVVNFKDSAKFNNETERKRTNNEKVGAGHIFGLEQKMMKVLNVTDTTKLVGLNSGMDSKGTGKIKRDEEIKLNVAATVTQRLPNGNLVIIGRQEMRVNYELRELQIAGIVRPEDIQPGNTITLDKIAEARISYGGRGHISEVQQERYGKQILDIVLPF
jgi:flagellar L-ring protein FlgH